jgi:UDP-glucose 4-epimerase
MRLVVTREGKGYNSNVMEKVVVTGGAGFIGSHIAEELASRDYQVTVVDNLSSGREENIAGIIRANDCELVRGSITDIALLQKVFQNVSYVFHLAALARVPQSVDDPLTTNEINVNGTLNVLMAAKENGVKKVIFSSSAAVYGDSGVLPLSEEMPLNPQSPYALTKLIGEHYSSLFSQIYDLPTVSLRYFNVFGLRQDPFSPYSNAIPLFIGRIARDLPPVIFDDGEQTRDFVYVRDVVRANLFAIKEGIKGVYNVGSGTSTTVNKLVRAILATMRKEIKPLYEKARLGDPRNSLADITKAAQFGFKPEFSLEEGLDAVIPAYAALVNQDRL